jgi:hypothetical protein
VDNATHPSRQHPLRTLTTLSNGYDSTACAVLGAEAGIRDALTLVPASSDADSGAAVGAHLGLRVVVRAAEAWKQQPGEAEIEFAAASSGPPKLPLATLEDGWCESLVLVGSLGDELWAPGVNDFTDHSSQAGAVVFSPESLHDFGLRTGVVFAHVPTIGSQHFRELRRMSDTEEMAPWSIAVNYNRPIARRIIEDAGIPRGSFAVRKHATAVTPPRDLLRPAARADFKKFWRMARRQQPPIRRVRYRFETAVVTPAIWRMGAVLWKLRRSRNTRRRMRAWSYNEALPSAYEFHWAVSRLVDRHRAALQAARPDSRVAGPADSL